MYKISDNSTLCGSSTIAELIVCIMLCCDCIVVVILTLAFPVHVLFNSSYFTHTFKTRALTPNSRSLNYVALLLYILLRAYAADVIL